MQSPGSQGEGSASAIRSHSGAAGLHDIKIVNEGIGYGFQTAKLVVLTATDHVEGDKRQ